MVPPEVVLVRALERARFQLARFVGLATLTAAYAGYAWLAFPDKGFSRYVCPFLAITGMRCPLCGLTHSIGALLHGDAALAIQYHPLGPLLLASAAMFLAGSAIFILRRIVLDLRRMRNSHIGHRRDLAVQAGINR